jgi:hypothetical protein
MSTGRNAVSHYDCLDFPALAAWPIADLAGEPSGNVSEPQVNWRLILGYGGILYSRCSLSGASHEDNLCAPTANPKKQAG